LVHHKTVLARMDLQFHCLVHTWPKLLLWKIIFRCLVRTASMQSWPGIYFIEWFKWVM